MHTHRRSSFDHRRAPTIQSYPFHPPNPLPPNTQAAGKDPHPSPRNRLTRPARHQKMAGAAAAAATADLPYKKVCETQAPIPSPSTFS